MSKGVYVLRHRINERALVILNGDSNPAVNIYNATGKLGSGEDHLLGEDGYVDLVHAAFSGKKIVNPLSPREELKNVYARHTDYVPGVQAGIEIAVKIIAKEHPDVKDWLGDLDV